MSVQKIQTYGQNHFGGFSYESHRIMQSRGTRITGIMGVFVGEGRSERATVRLERVEIARKAAQARWGSK